VIKKYIDDPKQKQHPNKHYILDFRSLLLTNHIRSILKDSTRDDKDLVYQSITTYDIYYLIYKVTKMVGDDLEAHDTVRAIIDYQYYEVTKPFYKW